MSDEQSRRPPGVRRAFSLPASGSRATRAVDEEFAFHFQERVEELVERGMDREAAEGEVHRRFGDVQALRRETAAIDARSERRASSGGLIGGSWRDLRMAVRGMVRRPGLTAAIVLTLALAIGASTAIFSVVDSVLLRPVPVPWLNELHVVRHDIPDLGLEATPLGPPSVEELIAREDLFSAGAAYSGTSFTLASDAAPRRVHGARTMGDFFELFDGRPLLGRTFDGASSEEGRHLVVVLGYSLWRDAFGGEPSIVGRSVHLSGVSYEVVGVMGPEFGYPRTAELWVPQLMDEGMRSASARNRLFMTPVLRVRPGVTDGQLAAGLDEQSRRWREELSLGGGGLVLRSTSLVDYLAGNLRPVLLLLTGAVGLVLLIACANVASLQLVRAIGRARELAVRAAIGAGRGLIVRQLLIESLALAVAGGVFGVVVALLLLKLMSLSAVGEYEMLADVHLNAGVLGMTAAVALGAGILLGLAPSLRAARTNLNDVLKDSSRGSSGGPARNRVLQAAVVLQVAFTLVLLLGAGVLARNLGRMLALDPGFDAERVYAMGVSIAGERFDTPEKRIAFFDSYLDRLRGTPGIESASIVSGLPFSGGTDSSPFTLGDISPRPDEPERHANLVVAGDDYFRTMGIPLLAGRDFELTDRGDSPLVAVIDQQLARSYFGDQDPIGQTISQGRPATIVGVVGTVKQGALHEPDKATVYYSNRHNHWIPSMQLVIRSSLPLGTVMTVARRSAQELDPTVPVYEPRTLDELVSRSLVTERLSMGVMTGFATLSLLLALLGVYGVISYAVSQRVPEIGIRLSLGATPAEVVRLVLAGGVGLVMVGSLIGIAVFLALGKQLQSMLHEISARDPLTLALGAGALLLTATVACWIPARRAARVSPVVAMRSS
ncbi:MAG TPA: ABC transporter permease [Gemmatimonadales bacterium]|nr:ABC transporter permease [Gemmatimonadales bacterium]